MREIVQKIDNCLKDFTTKSMRINQTGFMFSQFFIEKSIYKIETDILTLKDEKKDIYLSVNLNQVYQVKIAKKELELILEKVRTTLKFAPEDYKIMKLDKRIAKCLAGRLIISPDIVKYRKEIIEYIMFYEFCLLEVKKHGKKLYEMLQKYMPNYENYEYELIGIQY